jgi:hypothetical protein
MQDDGAISWVAVDRAARSGTDARTGDLLASANARDGRSDSGRTQSARYAAEFAECECPFDCLRDHENE